MTASSLISRRAKSSTSAIAVALLLLAGHRAEAADAFAKRVTKAQNCYERKLFDCAINELEAAYLIRPMPALLLNIAHAYLDYGRPRDAIVYYDRYMAEEKNLAPEARADVEKFKKQAEEKLVAMQGTPPPPPIEKPVEKPEEKPPEEKPPEVTPPKVDTGSQPSAAAKWAPIGAMAIGGALLISGFACGGAAMSTAKTVVATDGTFNSELDTKGKSLSSAAIALDVLGGVAIVGGLIPTIIRLTKKAPSTVEKATATDGAAPPPAAAPQVSLSFSSRGLVVLGRF